jgi:hypothetical protein
MTFRVGNSDLKMKNLQPYFAQKTLVVKYCGREINLITLLIYCYINKVSLMRGDACY